jgi:hypothetical protein
VVAAARVLHDAFEQLAEGFPTLRGPGRR